MYSLTGFDGALLTFVLLTLSQWCRAQAPVGAVGPVGNVQIVNGYVQPDGFNRSAVLAGGTYPGVTITGFKGDRFLLNVSDLLTDRTMEVATSVHWHGIHQEKTNWADGTSGITQCPLVPGESFLHNFTVPDQAGTYWYHSHYSTQYCDGLRGAFIVYDPEDPQQYLYDVDDESTIVTLSDWYHHVAPTIMPMPWPDSFLINGKGRYSGGPEVPLAEILVEQGKRYRLRVISSSCHPNYNFSIDGHTMTIIEADGENTEPLEVDSFIIYAGQRYSVVVNANQPVDNYWIRAQPNQGNTSFLGGLNSAILRYAGAPYEDPTTPFVPAVNPLVESDLHALTDPAAPGIPVPGAADVQLLLNATFDLENITYFINGYTYAAPPRPLLQQILAGAYTSAELLPSGSVYPLPRNKVIEVTIPGGGLTSPHPWHLHGHSISVVRTANSSEYNYVNPVRRDTANAGADLTDNMTFRFTTDNPGPWFLHCHLDWHLAAGMAVVFVEAPEDTEQYISATLPTTWDEICPTYNAVASQLAPLVTNDSCLGCY